MRRSKNRNARRRFSLLVGTTIVGLSVSASGWPSDDRATPASGLLDVLSRLPRHERLQTTFTVESLGPTTVGEPPSDRVLEARAFDLTVDGVRRRVVEHVAAAPDGSMPAVSLPGLWDGRLWLSQVGREAYVISASQPHTSVTDCWAMFHGIDMGSALGPWLQRIVQFGEVVDDQMIGDDRVIHAWMNEERSVHVELVFTIGEEPRLKSFRKDVYGPAGTSDRSEVVSSLSYVVDEWRTYDGRLLPHRAHRDITMFAKGARRASGKSLASRTVLTRQTASFTPEPLPGMTLSGAEERCAIMDTTLQCSYTFGTSLILIDGFVFRTTQPITGIVREELPAIVGEPVAQRAEIQDEAAKPEVVVDHLAGGRPSRFARGMLFSCVGLISCVIVLRFVRSRDAHGSRLPMRAALCWAVIGFVGGWATAPLARGQDSQSSASDSPLGGELNFDFGEVINTNQGPLRLTHEFVLSNVSGREISIDHIGSSCGCTEAKASRTTIPANERVTVTATLEILGTASRRERIWLKIGDQVVELTIAGRARPTRSFYTSERAVLLAPDAPANVIVTALTDDDQTPPAGVECIAPQGVAWQFQGWRLVYRSDETVKRPARWQGIVRISSDAASLPVGSSMEMQLAGWSAQRVDLTGRP